MRSPRAQRPARALAGSAARAMSARGLLEGAHPLRPDDLLVAGLDVGHRAERVGQQGPAGRRVPDDHPWADGLVLLLQASEDH
jgi:hypothetical protein